MTGKLASLAKSSVVSCSESTGAVLTFVPDGAVTKMVLGHPAEMRLNDEESGNPEPGAPANVLPYTREKRAIIVTPLPDHKEALVESQSGNAGNPSEVEGNATMKGQTSSDNVSKPVASPVAVELPSAGAELLCREVIQLPNSESSGAVELPSSKAVPVVNSELTKLASKTSQIAGVTPSVPAETRQNASLKSSFTPVATVRPNKPAVPVNATAVSDAQSSGNVAIKSVKSEKSSDKEVEAPKQTGPFFRLGMEGHYTTYVNQYSANNLALNKYQHMEQRDRRRSVINKFSVNEFKWTGELYGSKEVILYSLRSSVVAFEGSIPTAFMHPVWPLQRSTWVRAVHSSKTPCEFAAALTFFLRLIKPICFLPVWNDAAGHLKFCRTPAENRSVSKKKEHKEEEEEQEEVRDIGKSHCILFTSLHFSSFTSLFFIHFTSLHKNPFIYFTSFTCVFGAKLTLHPPPSSNNSTNNNNVKCI